MGLMKKLKTARELGYHVPKAFLPPPRRPRPEAPPAVAQGAPAPKRQALLWRD